MNNNLLLFFIEYNERVVQLSLATPKKKHKQKGLASASLITQTFTPDYITKISIILKLHTPVRI